jgi:hypothetical protein
MLTDTPLQPSSPFSPSDRATLRVPAVSNFGADAVTLILRRNGQLDSSAGAIARWHYEHEWVVCTLEGSTPQREYKFAVKKSDAVLRLVNNNPHR